MSDVQNPWDIQDLDTGTGENRVAVGIVAAGAGGPVQIGGTVANGLEVDVTQVTGTVTVDMAGNNDVIVAGTDAIDDPMTADPVFIGALADDSVPTAVSADGDAVGVWASREGAVRMTLTTEAGDLDLLPVAAALGDAMANPTLTQIGSHLLGFDGTDWSRVRVDGTSHRLQVDVITGGGSDTPTNEVTDSQTEVALAPATPTDVDSSEAESKKLAWIDFWSSSDWTADIHTVDNAIESARLGVVGGQAFQHVQYVPTHRNYIQTGTTGGADNFRAAVTNLGRQAADLHVVFHYED